MLLVGESINGTRKQVGEAIFARDTGFIESLAIEQVEAGAHVLDINGGVAGGDEVGDLLWLIGVVRGVSDTQLMVDSANPEALEAGVEAATGDGGTVPFINSISGEQGRIDAVLPLLEKYKCPVVGLCFSEEGIPATAAERLAIAERLLRLTSGAGLPPHDLWIDPLVLPISADSEAAVVTMNTLRMTKEKLPVRTIGGLSNVSFGLPSRGLLNRTFGVMCMGIGIDGALLDVRDKRVMAAIKAAEALRGEDPFCGNYLKAHRAGLLGESQAQRGSRFSRSTGKT
jgi:cobalamin-dependent methionine synthase I